jgi:hypothetical protein
MESPSLAIPFFERSLKISKKAQFDSIYNCLVSKGKETPYFAPAPSSAARSADACTASIMIPRIPPRSITCKALIVVPPGEVTSSFNCPGCFPILRFKMEKLALCHQVI